MDNCLFAFPDRLIPTAYTAVTLSGGNWVNTGDVALANLQDPDLATVARSTSLAEAYTRFNVDYGTVRDIRVLAMLRHNLSLTAVVRFTFWSDASQTQLVYDTGNLPVWLPFYPRGSLPWGHPSLWDGLISEEDLDGYQLDFIRVLPAMVSSRYARVEIDDSLNPAGYVELARCVMAPAWQPPVNYSYGNAIGWESNAIIERTPGGKEYGDEQAKWRVTTCELNHMSPGVAMSCVMEMQRRLGKLGELVFVYDPSASSQAEWQRSFLCRMEELSPIDNPYYNANSASFKLVEVL